jgi:uncharacterized protein
VIVVLDTNVVVSALQFANPKGNPVRACEKAKTRDTIAFCDQIEAEMFGVLTDTFRWSPVEARKSLAALMSNAIHVIISGAVKHCRDPHDDMFLECAEVAEADLLITGDKDLLVLGSCKRTQIVNPAGYLLI